MPESAPARSPAGGPGPADRPEGGLRLPGLAEALAAYRRIAAGGGAPDRPAPRPRAAGRPVPPPGGATATSARPPGDPAPAGELVAARRGPGLPRGRLIILD